MRRILSGPLSALMAISAFPAPAWAAAFGPAAPPAGGTPPAGEDDVVVVEDEMEGGAGEQPAGEKPAGDAGATPPAGDTDIDLFGEEPKGQPGAEGGEVGKADKDSEAKQIKAEQGLISVVQRQRMLKRKRFEVQPQFGITINDPYVRHYTIGLDLNYWLTNRMAIGLTGTGFIGQKTPRYDNIRFQEGLLLTANQILWQASVNYTYNPFYGKIAIFNRALLHWEGFLQVGGGAMQTRIIPRYESIHDPFSTVTGGGHIGGGGRFYVPRINWFSFNFGVRTWIYADKQEPINRGPDDNPATGGEDLPELNDPQNAKDAADFEVAFNVVFYLGVSFFFPTRFEYTTPR